MSIYIVEIDGTKYRADVSDPDLWMKLGHDIDRAMSIAACYPEFWEHHEEMPVPRRMAEKISGRTLEKRLGRRCGFGRFSLAVVPGRQLAGGAALGGGYRCGRGPDRRHGRLPSYGYSTHPVRDGGKSYLKRTVG